MSIYFVAALLLCAIDQITKLAAQAILTLPGNRLGVAIIPGAFYLTYTQNTGASFGILQGNSRALGIVSLIACALLTAFFTSQYKAHSHKRLYLASIAMIIAGAFGNMIDRLFRGYVIDMFDFRLIHFAIFNVADSCISVGAVIFCCYLLFDKSLNGANNIGIEQKERKGDTVSRSDLHHRLHDDTEF